MEWKKGVIKMVRRRFLAAQARYRCEWKCAHCGRLNRERGATHAADRIAVGQYTDNLPDEVNLSGQAAAGMARRRLFRLQARVNDHRWLRGLGVSGVCRKCGLRQFWAPAMRHAWATVAAVICLSLLLLYAGVPGNGPMRLAFGAAMLLAALFTEAAALLAVRWRLKRLADSECAPTVEEIPREE